MRSGLRFVAATFPRNLFGSIQRSRGVTVPFPLHVAAITGGLNVKTKIRLTELHRVLMRRDGMTAEDVDEWIKAARQAVEDGEDPEDILQDEFGLEPDYVFDLLGY